MTFPNYKMPKIALDSNVFRNIKFINYLIIHKDDISVSLPTIVQFEIGYFYLAKGLTWSEFLNYIQKFNAKIMDWNTFKIEDVLKNVIAQKSALPFKDHFRDFVIGTQCEALLYTLITYNSSHFKWIKQIMIQTPEAFITYFEKNYLSFP